MAYSHAIGGVSYAFESLAQLLACATPARSGDQLAGISAATAQERIAAQVGLQSSGALHSAVTRLGFRFERKGGLRLVDTLFGRSLTEWDSGGQLVTVPGESVLLAA